MGGAFQLASTPVESLLQNAAYKKPTKIMLYNRDIRLNNNIMTLYHQTSYIAAGKILISQKMIRGTNGLAGGGIYFATNKKDTYHKARQTGVILKCEVRLGNIKTVHPGFVNMNSISNECYLKLLWEGYDSVLIPRSGGDEFVVYNSDQVVKITHA